MMKDETKPHILLVEDARDIREPLARYLREHNYRATTAQDAASTIGAATSTTRRSMAASKRGSTDLKERTR